MYCLVVWAVLLNGIMEAGDMIMESSREVRTSPVSIKLNRV